MIWACLMAGIAAWMWIPDGRLPAALAPPARRRAWRGGWVVGALGLGVAAIVLPGMVWVAILACVSLCATWIVREQRAWTTIRRRREETANLAMSLAAMLKAGQVPVCALEMLSRDFPMLTSAAAAQRIGAQVSEALVRSSREPGCAGLAELARAWKLSEVTGAPIASLADRIADSQRRRVAVERIVSAELASARATGQLFALLPVLGIALGFMAGGNPVTFLIWTRPGNLCLLAAVVLACIGLIWVNRLAAPAGERSGGGTP